MLPVIMVRAHQVKMDPRVRMEASTLKKAGYDIRILYWNTKNEKHPDALEGVPLIELPYDGIMKIVKYESLNFHFWWKRGSREIVKNLDGAHPILHCFDFPTLPLCVKAKKKIEGARLIYDAADVWEYMVQGELPKMLLKYHLKLEKKCMRHVDFLIAPGEQYAEYYIKRGFPKERTGIVMNAKRMYVKEYIPPENENPTLLYIGSLKRNRKITELLQVIRDFDNITLKIGGFGPLTEEVKSYAERFSNIEFLGKVPYEKVMDYTLKSDALYVMFDNTHPLTRIGFPNKFFEATATGRALITSSGTYLGNLVNKLNMGIVVEPTPAGIKKALSIIDENPELLKELGKNAFKWGLEKYNWEREEKKLLDYYARLSE